MYLIWQTEKDEEQLTALNQKRLSRYLWALSPQNKSLREHLTCFLYVRNETVLRTCFEFKKKKKKGKKVLIWKYPDFEKHPITGEMQFFLRK